MCCAMFHGSRMNPLDMTNMINTTQGLPSVSLVYGTSAMSSPNLATIPKIRSWVSLSATLLLSNSESAGRTNKERLSQHRKQVFCCHLKSILTVNCK